MSRRLGAVEVFPMLNIGGPPPAAGVAAAAKLNPPGTPCAACCPNWNAPVAAPDVALVFAC